MSRKSKIDPIEKVKTVEQYLNGEISIRQAGKLIGAAPQNICKAGYEYIKLKDQLDYLINKNSIYSKELKINAVNDYINEETSLDDICKSMPFVLENS